MNIKDIFRCPIFQSVPDKKQESFLKDLDYSTIFFKKGDLIANQGDEVNSLYILIRGSVKTEMISNSGTVLNIEIIQAPNPLAPAFLFAENNRFPVDVITLEDSEIILIPKNTIIRQFAGNDEFLQAYMSYNSNRTQFLSERLKFLSLKSIKGKLAHYILERSKNMEFDLEMNQTELAEHFGIARPSLARSLSEMVDEQIIKLNKRTGTILNIEKLKELIIK